MGLGVVTFAVIGWVLQTHTMRTDPRWRVAARGVLAAFLVLAGVSLVLCRPSFSGGKALVLALWAMLA